MSLFQRPQILESQDRGGITRKHVSFHSKINKRRLEVDDRGPACLINEGHFTRHEIRRRSSSSSCCASMHQSIELTMSATHSMHTDDMRDSSNVLWIVFIGDVIAISVWVDLGLSIRYSTSCLEISVSRCFGITTTWQKTRVGHRQVAPSCLVEDAASCRKLCAQCCWRRRVTNANCLHFLGVTDPEPLRRRLHNLCWYPWRGLGCYFIVTWASLGC